MLDNAEVVLHDHFGNNEYWQCRQSMKFAEPLVQEAKRFMISVLNHSSVEENDIKNEKVLITKNDKQYNEKTDMFFTICNCLYLVSRVK